MMQHYPSGSSSQVTGGEMFPRDLTFHTRNAEEWNDFNENSGLRDKGRREHFHREFGNKKHEKLTEERHLESPTSKADQWRHHEYYQSETPNEKARIMRNKRTVNEHKEDVSPNGITTRKMYSHSSSVHVSAHMTTKSNGLKTGDGGMDFLSFESPVPLDHSPQKGKGNLGKQGALNQRRRPSKGSLKFNASPEDDNEDYYDSVYSSAREDLSPEVQRKNVENSLRSHHSINVETSHINSTITGSSKDSKKASPKRPEWLQELKERNLKKTHEPSSPVTIHSTSVTMKGAEEQSTSQPRKKTSSNTVTLVEGPTTKLVQSFNYESKTTKISDHKTSASPVNEFATYYKKQTSQGSYPGSITINGSQPATHKPRQQSPPRSPQQPPKTSYLSAKRETSSRQETVTNSQDARKSKTDKTNDLKDNRAIIMNEIRKFDHRNLRKQIELHQTNLWVSKDFEDDDHYGYSQSELTFDDDRDSSGWSPRVLSPFIHRGISPRAVSPNLQQAYSEPNLQPSWVQLANEKQQKSYDWDRIDQRHRLDSQTDAPWQEESTRKSENIRHLMVESSNDVCTNGVMSLDRRFGKAGSQESVSSWEWMESRDGKPPEWVEIAKQRQRMRYEMQEIEESTAKRQSSQPPWRNEVQLRATPGVPTKDGQEIRSPVYEDYDEPVVKSSYKPRAPKIETKTDSSFAPVRPELLQNIRLKKTSHLTKVKGPEVGRVINFNEPEQKSHSRPVVEPKVSAVDRTGRVSPTSRTSHKVNKQTEFTVDHVLSSIRLIRQASLSTSDLADLKQRVVVSPLSPTGRKDDDDWKTTRILQTPSPRSTSPLYSRNYIRTPDDTPTEGFHRTPQWILDLKAKKQQRRSQPIRSGSTLSEQHMQQLHVEGSSPRYENRSPESSPQYIDYSDGSGYPEIDKSATWSASTSRRQFRNVLQEIKNVSREELLVNVNESRNYGSLKRRPIEERTEMRSTNKQGIDSTYKSVPFEKVNKSQNGEYESQWESLVYRDRRSTSPTQRSSSPTSPDNEKDQKEHGGVSYEPLTWWIQVQPSSKEIDPAKRQKKIENLLTKKTATASQITVRTKQSLPSAKKSPVSAKKKTVKTASNIDKRSSPLSKSRSPSPSTSSIASRSKDLQGVATTTVKKSQVSVTTRTTPTRKMSPSTSPTRQPPQSPKGSAPGSGRGRSPTATTKATRSPGTPTTGRVSSQTPTSPTRGTPSQKSPSPKSTSPKTATKSTVPFNKSPTKTTISTTATKTDIMIGTQDSASGTERKTIRSPSPNLRSVSPSAGRNQFSPTRTPSTTEKGGLSMSSKATSHQMRQSSSINISSTQSSVITGRSSPKPNYSTSLHSPSHKTSPPHKTSPRSPSPPGETRGRFSQLLQDLSNSNLQRSQSLKSDFPYSSDEKGTFSMRAHGSDLSFLDSASLVRQVSSSSRSLNFRKPRVRFSSTEIVWPLDLEGHSPVTTCHHPVHSSE